MMRITLFSTFFLLLLVSCGTRETKSALKHGDVLKSSIENFEKDRKKLSTKLVASLEQAQEDLTAEDPNLPKASKDFEKDWNSIMKRYNDLQKGFDKVGKSSDAYFLKLDELSNNINKESLRNEELAKNKTLRQKWDKSYREAKISVDKITEVLEAGNDFHMVLVASSIRQKLEQNVEELNIIAQQAKTLLGDLEAFTQAGRELVEG